MLVPYTNVTSISTVHCSSKSLTFTILRTIPEIQHISTHTGIVCKQSYIIVISYLNTKLKFLFSSNRNILFEVNYFNRSKKRLTKKSTHVFYPMIPV